MLWQTARRKLTFEKPLIMAVLNVTPDSFSDGGKCFSIDDALRQAEKLIDEGADIIDVGGESTRPGSGRVGEEEEIRRVVPVIEALTQRFDSAVSIDTSKSEVAARAVEAGAEIINDISGLRFDERIAETAARYRTGLVLMHLRGTFETMHQQPPVTDIIEEVSKSLQWSIATAKAARVVEDQIALDVGLGFSKTFEQNLELIAKLDKLIERFPDFPLLVGSSRKSFIGKILGDAPVTERLHGTMASVAVAIWQGAHIVRVHDVSATMETIKTVAAIRKQI